ncbi:MAG TPA: hypothetical protein EYH59_00715 [Pyrodictium sp.]|nr:hypothetical protein [Pyrodictium sp.]
MSLPWCKPIFYHNLTCFGELDVVPGDLIISLDPHPVVYMPIACSSCGRLIAVKKYQLGSGPWRLFGYTLSRTFNTYSPREIIVSNEYDYEPLMHVEVPLLPRKGYWILCSARECANHICKLSSFSKVCSIVSLLGLYAAVGVTGSHLLGTAHAQSDIDVGFYGYYYAVKAFERINELLVEGVVRPLGDREVVEWAYREARSRGLAVSHVLKLYRPWSRFVFNNTVITISFWPNTMPNLLDLHSSFNFSVGKVVECIVEVEPLEPGVVEFPARVSLVKSSCGADELVLFDGLFRPVLWEGGTYRVRGILLRKENGNCIVVGVREELTYILPL